MAGALRHLLQFAVTHHEGSFHLICTGHHAQVMLSIEEPIQPLPAVGEQWRAAGGSFKEASRRAPAVARHRFTRDVQGEARRRIELGMSAWGHMLHYADIRR